MKTLLQILIVFISFNCVSQTKQFSIGVGYNSILKKFEETSSNEYTNPFINSYNYKNDPTYNYSNIIFLNGDFQYNRIHFSMSIFSELLNANIEAQKSNSIQDGGPGGQSFYEGESRYLKYQGISSLLGTELLLGINLIDPSKKIAMIFGFGYSIEKFLNQKAKFDQVDYNYYTHYINHALGYEVIESYDLTYLASSDLHFYSAWVQAINCQTELRMAISKSISLAIRYSFMKDINTIIALDKMRFTYSHLIGIKILYKLK